MAYQDIADMAVSSSLRRRVAASAAQEDATITDPDDWTAVNRYKWAAAPGWDAAWASAVAGNNPDPGSDPGVITDGMILSQVQTLLA
jgi:hypothetical protein